MYTRKGDKGETSLYGPRRVSKDSARVEAYGTIDELNSLLGVVISLSSEATVTAPLIEIQKMLFVAGADAASDLSAKEAPRITAKDTLKLEEMTDALLRDLPTLRNFILPGGTEVGAQLHLARSVCRRAERRILTASKTDELTPELLPFFNRLSTYLFNLSRYENHRARRKEAVWKG